MKFVILMAFLAFAAAHNPAYLMHFDHAKLKAAASKAVEETKKMYHCFKDDSKCSEGQKLVKDLMHFVFATSCAECHPDDKHTLAVVLKAGQDNAPEEYKDFIAKYDPEGKQQANVKKFIEENINTQN